jgi:predicted NAD-dependent protein-ADP-ribosyltransferase YbiA (DUF1768 family)
MLTTHPAEQKRLGRRVRGFYKASWDEVKVGVMRKGIEAKVSKLDICFW